MASILKYRGSARYQTFDRNIDRRQNGSFFILFLDTAAGSSIEFSTRRLPNIIGSFSLYKLDLLREYQVSSIEHNSGIVA